MEVQIISVEAIKPSSPTPSHNKIFNLSLLDQLIPAPYAPLIFFYPNSHRNYSTTHLQEFLENLKKSLSETLTLFYPLAGEIKDDLSIDCTDQGAHFATAKVKNINLSRFLTNLDIQVLPQLLPCGTGFESNQNEPSSSITNIQVNIFECGGLAIGICIAHKIVDGTSLSTFLKSWAHATCNYSSASSEKNMIISPDFIASSLFPTNNSTWLQDSANKMFFSMFKKGNPKTKRLVFDHSSIEKIRAEATRPGSKCPSRVETVSAYLWKCFLDITPLSQEKCYVPKKHSLLTHLVNLRRRVEPNLSEYSIGNLIWISNAKLLRTNDQNEEELSSLVGKIRDSISKINGELVKKFKNGDEGHVLMRESLEEIEEYASMEGGVDHYAFTSRCNFGFYEVDFGWGKPIWVSGIGASDDGSFYMNFIVLMDTKCGEGVEAWVTLDEQYMEVLVQNVDDSVDIDPSPLDISHDTGC